MQIIVACIVASFAAGCADSGVSDVGVQSEAASRGLSQGMRLLVASADEASKRTGQGFSRSFVELLDQDLARHGLRGPERMATLFGIEFLGIKLGPKMHLASAEDLLATLRGSVAVDVPGGSADGALRQALEAFDDVQSVLAKEIPDAGLASASAYGLLVAAAFQRAGHTDLAALAKALPGARGALEQLSRPSAFGPLQRVVSVLEDVGRVSRRGLQEALEALPEGASTRGFLDTAVRDATEVVNRASAPSSDYLTTLLMTTRLFREHKERAKVVAKTLDLLRARSAEGTPPAKLFGEAWDAAFAEARLAAESLGTRPTVEVAGRAISLTPSGNVTDGAKVVLADLPAVEAFRKSAGLPRSFADADLVDVFVRSVNKHSVGSEFRNTYQSRPILPHPEFDTPSKSAKRLREYAVHFEGQRQELARFLVDLPTGRVWLWDHRSGVLQVFGAP